MWKARATWPTACASSAIRRVTAGSRAAPTQPRRRPCCSASRRRAWSTGGRCADPATLVRPDCTREHQFGVKTVPSGHAMECEMSTAARFTITLSDRLNREFEEVIGEDDESKANAFRKAVQLYIVSTKAAREGKKVGIAKPNTELATEFINL